MKSPTAPVYPDLNASTDDGHNYRLQKISDVEKQLLVERGLRKALYKKYKRGINLTDGFDTLLISTSVILAGVGLAIPVLLPLEIVAVVCGCMGVCVKAFRRKLMSKAQKHYEIKTIADSKLNSIKDLVSKALTDGQISENEFTLMLDELDKYNKLKDNIHSKQTGLSEAERKKLIEEGKAQAKNEMKKKDRKCLILFNKVTIVNDPPPKYES